MYMVWLYFAEKSRKQVRGKRQLLKGLGHMFPALVIRERPIKFNQKRSKQEAQDSSLKKMSKIKILGEL